MRESEISAIKEEYYKRRYARNNTSRPNNLNFTLHIYFVLLKGVAGLG